MVTNLLASRLLLILFSPVLLGDVLSIAGAQLEPQSESQSQQERLRGSITPERSWWDVQHYRLEVEINPEGKQLSGSNRIRFKTLQPGDRMQIDLQPPLEITKILHQQQALDFQRDGNVYWVDFESQVKKGAVEEIVVFYEGTPKESKNPPWSGGISWQKDEKGNHFIATSCQGIGASIWWPNKDHGYDEPDAGMDILVTVPDDLTAVANGRLKSTEPDETRHTRTFHWQVVNPINNYCVNVNIGNYVNFSETYRGEGGPLDLDYWVLEHQRERAEKQFKEAPRTLAAFEHWFGKYPFYEDSFKLVAVPYLGMEHQSSVTYGNGFQNGYRGRDLSGTGVGLKFDFIIVHESGHEWFGNNISMKDSADMWIHESFTNYSENLFVEYHFNKQQGADYVIGCRRLVKNDRPIIAEYDRNQRGSGDMYYKGGNMLHTMRHILDNDEKWRKLLRQINAEFWHQTVTTEQIESFINDRTGIDFSKVFDQYLRSTEIPVLQYQIENSILTYQYKDVVPGFQMPVDVWINGTEVRLHPSEREQSYEFEVDIKSFEVDRNFYVNTKRS